MYTIMICRYKSWSVWWEGDAVYCKPDDAGWGTNKENRQDRTSLW